MRTSSPTGATAAPDHPHALATGTRLLWYEIRAVLGQGGFGITYLAHDNNLDQPVAIKEFLPAGIAARRGPETIVPATPDGAADFEWGLRRFVEEGRTVARFDHPAIVRVQSVFEANGTAYLVMRYERGESLGALLRRVPRLPEAHLRRILHDVMLGLEVMHAAGFIHRDIKPGNIYLRDDGRALLIDFGAARQALSSHTRALTSVVSPGYAPFEQYRADGVAQGPWTDIYALGATAYRAIRGQAPETSLERSHRLLEGQADCLASLESAENTDYSPALISAINRALAFRAAERPQSIAHWRACFNAAAGPGSSPATVPTSMRAAGAPFDEVTTVVVTHNGTRPAWRPWASALAGFILAIGVTAAVLTRHDRDAGEPQHVRAAATRDAAPAVPTAERALVLAAPVAPPGVMPSDQAAPADRSAEIQRLLAAAAADVSALRLTTPPGANAWERYREVLTLETRNADAEQGLDFIVGRYLDLAAHAAARADYGEAREYVARAGDVRPHDPRVAQAQAELARREAGVRLNAAARSAARD